MRSDHKGKQRKEVGVELKLELTTMDGARRTIAIC